MATLSSSSTDAEVQAAYEDNASYLEDNSPTKARAFITACTILLVRLPKRVNQSSSGASDEIELDLTQIKAEREEARKWLAANGSTTGGGGGAIRHTDLSGFRD